jgi:multisubunit Na+/H+ antiporter MnhB subunit
MNKPHHLNNAKAIIALLILAIAFVIFYKFATNQNYYSTNPVALQDYVIYAIIGGGFLVGLLYLTSNTTHKAAAKRKSTKTAAKKKRKK